MSGTVVARLAARGVIDAVMAEAARLWAADHAEAGRDVMAAVVVGRVAPRARTRAAGWSMDYRAEAARRFRAAVAVLEEFEGVCRAVVLLERSLGEWAAEVGVRPEAAADRLRLGLMRLARYYQVRAEVA